MLFYFFYWPRHIVSYNMKIFSENLLNFSIFMIFLFIQIDMIGKGQTLATPWLWLCKGRLLSFKNGYVYGTRFFAIIFVIFFRIFVPSDKLLPKLFIHIFCYAMLASSWRRGSDPVYIIFCKRTKGWCLTHYFNGKDLFLAKNLLTLLPVYIYLIYPSFFDFPSLLQKSWIERAKFSLLSSLTHNTCFSSVKNTGFIFHDVVVLLILILKKICVYCLLLFHFQRSHYQCPIKHFWKLFFLP